jgi:hypothetical protein
MIESGLFRGWVAMRLRLLVPLFLDGNDFADGSAILELGLALDEGIDHVEAEIRLIS